MKGVKRIVRDHWMAMAQWELNWEGEVHEFELG